MDSKDGEGKYYIFFLYEDLILMFLFNFVIANVILKVYSNIFKFAVFIKIIPGKIARKVLV